MEPRGTRLNEFEKTVLLVLILLAAALRFHRLDAQDIWGDEAFSIFLSQMPLPAVIAGAADTHPPFYPLLLFIWLKFAGASAFATRALSALIGILVVPLIFVFAKRLAARACVGWFAAILAAVSPLLIYYSQETRMYELATLLALGSTYFALRLVVPLQRSSRKRSPLALASVRRSSVSGSGKTLEGERLRQDQSWRNHGRRTLARGAEACPERNRREQRGKKSPLPPCHPAPLLDQVAYLAATALALYTHYSAFFVLAAENLFVLWRSHTDRAARVRWGILQLLLIASYIPWIIVQSAFLRGKASARFDEWGWRGVEMIFGKTLLAFSVGLTVDFPLAQIATMAFLILFALGLFAIVRAREANLWLAPLYFGAPIVIAWIINPVMPFFFERYVLVALPGFYVTLALGLDYLARQNARAAIGIMGAFVLVSAFSLAQYYYNDAYAKGKYGQMMAYVASHAQPGDALILNNPLQKPLYEYYAPRGIPAFYFPDGAPLEDPRTRQQFEEVARGHQRLWLVRFGNPAEYDPTGYLERWLGTHAFKSFFRGFVDASLSLYVMPSPPVDGGSQRGVRATLGEKIRLFGYTLDRVEIAPGETLQLTLYWQATARIDKRYTAFAHLIGALNPATQSPVWAQMDGEPVGGSRATTTWQIGETITDRYGLLIPQNIPPGDYLIEVGMYDPTTLVRLPVHDENGNRIAEDRVLLGTVRVNAR